MACGFSLAAVGAARTDQLLPLEQPGFERWFFFSDSHGASLRLVVDLRLRRFADPAPGRQTIMKSALGGAVTFG